MSQENHGSEPPNQDQSDTTGDGHNNGATPSGRTIAEWTTLVISVAIVLAIFGLVTYLYFRGEELPASIAVDTRLNEVRQDAGLYYLPVEVMNEGDQTVEDVVIEAELDTGSGQPETAEFTVVFLAGGEQVRGTFIFEEDPSQGELTARAISYKEP